MKKQEIGGDFSMDDRLVRTSSRFPHQIFFPKFSDVRYTFLGRMALKYILTEILEEQEIKRVLFPNYLCSSMIQPALELELPVEYYRVTGDNGRISFEYPNCRQGDTLVLMSYFGYRSGADDSVGLRAKGDGAIVVEDSTHRMLSERSYSDAADYVFVSLRKWVALPAGGVALKRSGRFNVEIPLSASIELTRGRLEAMSDKSKYLAGENVDKNEMLARLHSAERTFDGLEEILLADPITMGWLGYVDWTAVTQIRRRNARVLQNILTQKVCLDEKVKESSVTSITPLLNLQEGDTPLFVPIRVNVNERNGLHRELIQNELYMPLHWPLPNEMGAMPETERSLYDETISLVVDQRYDEHAMKLIASNLRDS